MDMKQIARLFECLESARTRPAMCFGAMDVEAAMHFLNGVGLAVSAFVGDHPGTKLRVIADRGWRVSGTHPSREMIERGWTPAEVIDEMFVIEIETIRRLVGPDFENFPKEIPANVPPQPPQCPPSPGE
ncbi:MAG TPA: hypothetical protein VH120_15985 [Gemmataceae bacterium]|nr:hypothetical protein [Gemmataceae bacterium]